jgi:hypothetical protein
MLFWSQKLHPSSRPQEQDFRMWMPLGANVEKITFLKFSEPFLDHAGAKTNQKTYQIHPKCNFARENNSKSMKTSFLW